jgi:hypothetical protein
MVFDKTDVATKALPCIEKLLPAALKAAGKFVTEAPDPPVSREKSK